MKRKTILILMAALLTAAPLLAQYSPCYEAAFAEGKRLYKEGKYTQAKRYFNEAKECPDPNTDAANEWIGKCDNKISENMALVPAMRNDRVTVDKNETYMDVTIDEVSFRMIKVEGGSFFMGAQFVNPSGINYEPDADEKEGPVHEVSVNTFYMGETEVTQALWATLMDERIGFCEDNQCPVENVSWSLCREFVQKLSKATGLKFRMPTEAEWEFAARGGVNHDDYKFAGSEGLDSIGWYWQNSGDAFLTGYWNYKILDANNCHTHYVKTKQPNSLGIYDMSGNVWEWCSDKYGKYASVKQANPKGYTGNTRCHVTRGGCWRSEKKDCRVSKRNEEGGSYYELALNCGLRLVLDE